MVSGWGWSLGYVGGLAALGLALAWIINAEQRGVPSSAAVPATLLITAAVYALASSVTFIWLKERAATKATPQTVQPGTTWQRLRQTFADARRLRDLFMVCLVAMCYQAGVTAVITLAAIYAQEAMGFATKDILVLVLVVNVTACIGAFAFGYAQDRIGKTRALGVTLVGWVMMVLCAWAATSNALFWVAANLAGLCMGASQSAGRALVAYLSPPDRVAEMFGLFGVATRLAAILGPITYGAVSWISAGDHRLAMLMTGLFFVASLALLTQVDERRGRQAVAPARIANA